MAGSVNKVILIGNLGNDPEIRTMQSGDRVANLSLATSESWKDKETGERRERTEWHRITVWNQGLIKIIEAYLKKGSKIYIEGQLETKKWQNDAGEDRYTTEVVLRPFRGEMIMLDSKPAGASSENPAPAGTEPAPQAAAEHTPVASTMANDDEIPF